MTITKLSRDYVGACFIFLVLTQDIMSSCQWAMYDCYYECLFFKHFKIHCFFPLNTFGCFWELKRLRSQKRQTGVFSSHRLYLTSVTFTVEGINRLCAVFCARLCDFVLTFAFKYNKDCSSLIWNHVDNVQLHICLCFVSFMN